MYLKTIQKDQISTVRESLHEFIPLTGAFKSGAYGTYPNETNILKFSASHDLFESVYDYPYASSSANHIFDITFGISPSSGIINQASSSMVKMGRIYEEMAQVCLGFDVTGNIRDFKASDTSTFNFLYFTNLSRLLVKDGISLGSIKYTGVISGSVTGTIIDKYVDVSGTLLDQTTARVDSPVGQYSYLYFVPNSDTNQTSSITEQHKVGLAFYQQGVIALDPSKLSFPNLSTSGTLTDFLDELRATEAVSSLQFQNTVQIYSTIYNCNVGLNEFNYSANPTYTSGSQIVVKNTNPLTPSTTYITTIGLYSQEGELTAVAKLSEPLKKTAADALNLRVRLDF